MSGKEELIKAEEWLQGRKSFISGLAIDIRGMTFTVPQVCELLAAYSQAQAGAEGPRISAHFYIREDVWRFEIDPIDEHNRGGSGTTDDLSTAITRAAIMLHHVMNLPLPRSEPPNPEPTWERIVHNRTSVNVRWDEDAKVFVSEFPRLLSQAETKERAIEALQDVVRIKSHIFMTGQIPALSAPTLDGAKARCPKCRGSNLTFKEGSDLVGWLGKMFCADCTGEWSYYDIEDWTDFAQFFQPPACGGTTAVTFSTGSIPAASGHDSILEPTAVSEVEKKICRHEWPSGLSDVSIHCCIELGEHQDHKCGCGATCSRPIPENQPPAHVEPEKGK